MAFKKLTAPSLTDLFVNELERMILSKELEIGEKLPPERKLAEEMKVSLAVINAGITRLTALGFLRVVPRKGVFVADYIRDGNMSTMKEIIEYTGNELDYDVLEPVSRFRRSIELAATKAACHNRTEEALAILEGLVERAEKKEEISNLPDIGFQFHHEVAVASGNIYYPMIIQSCKPLYILFYRMHLSLNKSDKTIKSLQDTLIAIQNRDTKAAETAINAAIDRWMEAFEKEQN